MKSNIKRKAERLLKSVHLRRTESRTAVLSALLCANEPMTQDQIAASLALKSPNKVTIYRVLESFIAVGLVHKVFLQEKPWHFEMANNCSENQCHPHFTCTSCGVTHCLVGVSIPIVKGLEEGFVIHRQQVCLEGFCPQCA